MQAEAENLRCASMDSWIAVVGLITERTVKTGPCGLGEKKETES